MNTCPWRLRELFNARDFDALIAAGTVTLVPKPGNKRLAPAALQEVPGTVSEMLWCVDVGTDTRLALFHQYHRPDCTLAASGHKDPKYLVVGDDVMTPSHTDNAICDYCRARNHPQSDPQAG